MHDPDYDPTPRNERSRQAAAFLADRLAEAEALAPKRDTVVPTDRERTLALMLDMDPVQYALANREQLQPATNPETGRISLRRLMKQCSCCETHLFRDRRSTCKLCGAVVCRANRRCHEQHSKSHLIALANKMAVDMSKGGK